MHNLALTSDNFGVFGEPEEEYESEDVDSDVSSSSSNGDFMNEEFRLHKRDYYMNKLEYEQVTP